MSRYHSTESSHTKQAWYATTALVESVLFIGVQAIMVLCVVLVAAHALTAA